jgi:hypothetical protein
MLLSDLWRTIHRPAEAHHRRFSLSLKSLRNSLPMTALFLLCLLGPTRLHAETISGTILDPSGAVIASARIEITGENLAQAVILSSDGQGKFVSTDLKPGKYSIKVTCDGFEPLIKTVDLQGAVQIQLTLAIAQQQVSVSVTGKSQGFGTRQLSSFRKGL